MDFELIPIKEILDEITHQRNAQEAFSNIIRAAPRKFPSKIWEEFRDMSFIDDISDATNWIQRTLDDFPNTKGIYLGLDTLNMNGGKGSNVEIGLNSKCDPSLLSMEWVFDCDQYGPNHLIKGLYSNSESGKWTRDEESMAEYVVFLGYGGLILRESLLEVKIKNDFISNWGFHDGDMFLLVNKVGMNRKILANVDV
ncbi:hypothetical protein ACX0G9_31035 [Flavitalea flava]